MATVDNESTGDIVRSWLASGVTTAALVAVGVWGHQTHWTLPGFGQHAGNHGSDVVSSADSANAVSQSAKVAADPSVIKFASVADVEKSGIRVSEVIRRPLIEEIEVNGVISYNERYLAQLSPRVRGTVWKALRRWGDEVEKGEPLAIIESEAVGQLKADFLNALVTSESRIEALKLLDSVKGEIARKQYREAEIAVREAGIRLMNAEQLLVNLGFNIHADEYKILTDEVRVETIRRLGLPESVKATLDPRTGTSNLLPLSAPFSGVIVQHNVTVGEIVEPSSPVFRIADTSRMWVRLFVPRDDVGKLAIGQPIRFKGDGISREIEGHISWMHTEVDEVTRTLEVRAEIDNPIVSEDPETGRRQRLLRAHTYGTGFIRVAELGDAIAVPNDALQWDADAYVVFTQEDDTTFVARRVQRGVEDKTFTQVIGELPVGARVAGDGSHVLKSQMILARLAQGAN